MTPGEAACVTPGEAASMNPGGAVKVGGDAGVRDAEALETSLRELVAAGVAEALETSLALPSGASDYHLGAHFVKARREARLVAASRGDYAFLQRDAAQYEEFAQREAHFEKVQREARLRCASRRGWAFLSREQREAHFEKALCEVRLDGFVARGVS